MAPLARTGQLPRIAILPSQGVETVLDRKTADRIAGDLVANFDLQAEALSARRPKDLAQAAIGDELTQLTRQIRAASGGTIEAAASRLDGMRVRLEAGHGQGPAIAVVTLDGTRQLTAYKDVPPVVVRRDPAVSFRETLELQNDRGRWLVAHVRSGRPVAVVAAPEESAAMRRAAAAGFAGVRLTDVAKQVGLDFRQDAFRFGVSTDTPAMMGGGLCWLDYDNDGWLDLFVVNNFAESDIGAWDKRGGLPRSALFHNVHGKFVNVTARTGAGLDVRGQGCVAADLNGDGHTDLFVSTASDDKLLWNNGDGTFTEGARSSGVVSFGWHSGAAVGDVNGDGRPDLFVAGYTEANGPIPGSMAGYPTNHLGVRDLLFLNEGNGPNGHARFREVGQQAGIDPAPYDHSLGAVFTDLNGDGRLDLYVANDEDPNRWYVNVPAPRARLPLRRPRPQRGPRRPERGHGHRRGGLQRRRAARPAREQLARAGARRLPQPRRVVRERAGRVRCRFRDELHRLGRVVGRPEQRREARPRARERGDTGHEPGQGRRAGAGAGEPRRRVRERDCPRRARRRERAHERPRGRRRRLRQRRARGRGDQLRRRQASCSAARVGVVTGSR